MSSKRILDIRRAGKGRTRQPSRARPRALLTTPSSQKPARLRARRRKIRLIVLALAILCGAGLVGGAGFVSHMEQLAIQDISVSGARTIAPAAVTSTVEDELRNASSSFFSRANIFLYPRTQIEDRLAAAFPRIGGVDIARPSLLAQAIVVTIEEREPFARWCGAEGACFVMDESGFIFAEDSGQSAQTSYEFTAGLIPHTLPVGQTFLQGRLRGIVELLDALRRAGFDAQGIRVENEKDFSVRVSDGPALLITFDFETERTLRNLQLALAADAVRDREDQLEYVDLRFGNRVYYKFRGE